MYTIIVLIIVIIVLDILVHTATFPAFSLKMSITLKAV